MIVNVNPYDTGFDENAHVMRFSAVAREIQTTASNKVGVLRRQISTQFSALKQAVCGPMKIKVVVPVLPKIEEFAKNGQPRETSDFVLVEEEIEVVEEDDSDEEDERDLLVEHLFEQLREMKTKVGLNGDPERLLITCSFSKPRCVMLRSKWKSEKRWLVRCKTRCRRCTSISLSASRIKSMRAM